MGKNMGLTYVKDFSFPAEQGFTGSAGVHKVRGYMRGGHVKQPVGKGGARQKMPKNVKAKGGEVKAQMGGFMGPEREISVDDVTISVPKMKGGKMSMHDKLYKEGGKMGYAYGGQVKPSDTSAQFKMTKGKQKTMDHGVQPAQKGRNEAEVEAGGNKRLKAGYQEGGGVHRTRYAKGGTAKKKKSEGQKGVYKGMTGVISDAERAKIKQLLKESGKIGVRRELLEFLGISRRKPLGAAAVKAKLKMLKGQMSDYERQHMEKMGTKKKAHGGLAKYAAGGPVGKAEAAQ